jgi:predicted NAD/FAD-binding protein
MGAAIWSADPIQMFNFPARFFIKFFNNHGMLNINDRPTWYVIKDGSKSYVEKLVADYRKRIRLKTPIRSIRRRAEHVEITPYNGDREIFDQVFLACHSDQALKMLEDPSNAENEILSAIPYQENEAVLHTDDSLLPKRRLAWAAWNYHVLPHDTGRVALTYNMNILQNIKAPRTFCVTLNNTSAIDPSTIIKRLKYDHPMFTTESVTAQKRHREIEGVNRTYFCGAYWRNGFHEDGVVSALNSLKHFQENTLHEKLHLRRAS